MNAPQLEYVKDQVKYEIGLYTARKQFNQHAAFLFTVVPATLSALATVFIGASEKSRLAKIVEDVKNRPVLTVSEVEGFVERSGGMVNLVTGPNRIIMEINREATGQAKLSLSSQLLRLAKVYPR